MLSLVRTLALTVGLLLVLSTNAFANCGNAADVDPADPGASLRAARSATLCLLNQQRRSQHLHRLRFNHKLALAGLRHARDMVQNDYFSHNDQSGGNFVDRIFDTNYVPSSAKWLVGENLAWGNKAKATPRQIVIAWMHSPAHRHNILTPGFREIGIAIVVGAPVNGVRRAATYATEFGSIHRQ